MGHWRRGPWWLSLLIGHLLLSGCGSAPSPPQSSVSIATVLPTTSISPAEVNSPTPLRNAEADLWATLMAGPTPTPLPVIPTPDVKTRIDVGGYKLAITCSGAGRPTVVIDAGLGTPSTDWATFPLLAGLPRISRYCVYDRAGLGASDPGPKPRTSEHIVRELHTLLHQAGVEGPYVLVGHSFGGMNMRLYARSYAQEVAGLVLVDSAHPDQVARLGRILPAEVPDEPADLHAFRLELVRTAKPEGNAEGVDVEASAAQVRAVRSLGDLPLVVLTAGKHEAPAGIAAQVDHVWLELQRDLVHLSSNSVQMLAAQAGHAVHRDDPDLVLQAIRNVVEAVRNRRRLHASGGQP